MESNQEDFVFELLDSESLQSLRESQDKPVIQENLTFEFLNPKFLQSHGELKFFHVKDTFMEIWRSILMKREPHTVLGHFTFKKCCSSPYAKMCRYVCAFHSLFHLQENHSLFEFKEDLHAFFNQQSLEEWILWMFEYYFMNTSDGGNDLREMIAYRLFHSDVNVIYKNCATLCNPYKEFKHHDMRERLELLFRKVEMCRFKARESLIRFQSDLLPTYKEILSEKAYKCLNLCFEEIESDCWTGKWYIYDIPLCVNDLLENSEIKISSALEADFVFVIILVCLFNGVLTEWSVIREISFGEIFETFHATPIP